MIPAAMTSTGPAALGPPPRVATVGFQGFGNVGDEAILAGIEALFGDRVRVTTVFCGGRQPVPALPRAARVRTFRHLPTPAAIRRLRTVDVLVISGGGLMNDYWPAVIPRFVLWCVAARLCRADVVWVGAGIGPIRWRPWRWAAGLAFRLSRLVTVRDAASLAWVRRCSARAEVRVVPDPAFFGTRPTVTIAGDGVGIVARGPTPADASRGRDLVAALAAVAVDVARRGERVELVSLHPDADRMFFADVQEAIRATGMEDLRVTWLPPDPLAAAAHLATFDRLLTVRLHGLILSALAGVPAVSVGYDRKVREAAEMLGLGDLAVALEDASAPSLIGALDRLAAEPERRARLASIVADIRAEGPAVAAQLLGAMR